MSSETSQPSGIPPSMGPGARPVRPGQPDGPSRLEEIIEMRSHYEISVDPSTLNIGYELRGIARSYRIPFESMPLGNFSRWVLYGGTTRTKTTGTFVTDVIRGAENMTGRALSQKEAEGFAFHGSRKVQYSYIGAVTAFVSGYSYAWAVRQNMKFPFMKPKPIERYDNFPNRYLPVLKGQYARIMWHITRANVSTALAILFTQPIFGFMGDSRMMVGLYQDERTKDLVMSVKGVVDRFKSNAKGGGMRGRPQTRSKSAQQDQGESTDRDPQEYYANTDGSLSSDYGTAQDFGGHAAYTDSKSDTEVLDDNSMRAHESQQCSPAKYQKSSQRQRYPVNPQPQRDTENSPTSDFYFDDDASPTAGNDPDMAAPQPYRSSGSAWDRVRRGFSSQNDRKKGTDASSSNSDQSMEDSSDPQRNSYRGIEENQYATASKQGKQSSREQAQKEFDQMLERERGGTGTNDYASSGYSADGNQDRAGESVWETRRRGRGS